MRRFLSLIGGVLLLASLSPGTALAQMTFLEFHWINKHQATIEDAIEYCEWVETIAPKVGGRINATYTVHGVVKAAPDNSQPQPDVVFVFTIPNKAAMKKLRALPEYKARDADRKRIFDFSRNILWSVSPVTGHGSS